MPFWRRRARVLFASAVPIYHDRAIFTGLRDRNDRAQWQHGTCAAGSISGQLETPRTSGGRDIYVGRPWHDMNRPSRDLELLPGPERNMFR